MKNIFNQIAIANLRFLTPLTAQSHKKMQDISTYAMLRRSSSSAKFYKR